MNKFIAIGRITNDLELRKTQNGKSILNFKLAINRIFKQEGQQESDFIRCIAWGKKAEVICQYMSKGSQIAIEGRVETGSYNDKDSKKIYTTDVVIENVDFLDNKKNQHGPVESVDNLKSEKLVIDDNDLPF